MKVNAKWRGLGESVFSRKYKENLNTRYKEINSNNKKPNIEKISNLIITKNYFAKNSTYINLYLHNIIQAKKGS